MLGFLEKVTVSPQEISATDVIPLRAVGLTDKAIEEALYVCALFNLMDRLADTFDFPLMENDEYQKSAKTLFSLGYASGSVPG